MYELWLLLVLAEKRFRKRYTKAPSFLSMHLGIKADVLPKDCDCHHIIVEVGRKGGQSKEDPMESHPSWQWAGA